MSITFPVDDVEPNLERLPPDPALLAKRIGGAPIAHSEGADRLAAQDSIQVDGVIFDIHSLIHAIHLAYKEHRPLRLTPDALWLTIAQGFSIHVNHHHEALRERFVRHAGQKTLRAANDLPPSREGWEHAISQFASALEEEIGAGLVRLLTCSFSTTTPAARAASQVVLMEAMKRYFEFEYAVGCGIPRITLEGTAEDYRDIRRRVEVMAEYDLGWWADVLLPVIDQWIRAAEGDPDPYFWRSIYNIDHDYVMTEYCSGWIQRLFPYIGEIPYVRSRFAPHRQPESLPAWQRPWVHSPMKPIHFPRGFSHVPVRTVGAQEGLYTLVAGLFGVCQGEDGAVEPCVGWAAREDEMEVLWRKIRAFHQYSPPVPLTEDDLFPMHGPGQVRFPEMDPALLRMFHEQFHDARLHGGAVSIRPFLEIKTDYVEYPLSSDRRTLRLEIRRIGDCADGSGLLLITRKYQGHLPFDALDKHLVVRDAGAAEDYRDMPVLARSFLEFLQRAVEGDAPYFLEPGYEPHGPLRAFLG